MTFETQDTIQCIHCGATIEAAAKICKHCSRAVGTLPEAEGLTPAPGWNSASAPSAGPTWTQAPVWTPPPSPVLVELRSFLVQRNLMRREQVDVVLNANPSVDAGVALGRLAAAGYITPAQAETLRAAFWQQQGQRAQAVLNAAMQRGLLMPAYIQAAIAQYESIALQQTIGEFLVACRCLTVQQALEVENASLATGRVDTPLRTRWESTRKGQRAIIIMGVVLLFATGVSVLTALTRFLQPAPNLGWHCSPSGGATATAAVCHRTETRCVNFQQSVEMTERRVRHDRAELMTRCHPQPVAFCHSGVNREWDYMCWSTLADCVLSKVLAEDPRNNCRERKNPDNGWIDLRD